MKACADALHNDAVYCKVILRKKCKNNSQTDVFVWPVEFGHMLEHALDYLRRPLID